jgi:hypothetical protein
LERSLSCQAVLRGSKINVEVLCKGWAGDGDHPNYLWPYYEVPDAARKYDVDQILYLAVPQLHASYLAYFQFPMTAEGIPASIVDPEYLLKPFQQKTLDPTAKKFWKDADQKRNNLVSIDEKGVVRGGNLPDLLVYDDLREDLAELMGRPMGLLSRKLEKMRTSSGKKVGFRLCFAPLSTLSAENFGDLWGRIARSQNIPFFDLTGPVKALAPSFQPLTEGGHQHFYPQGHAFLSEILTYKLIEEGIVPLRDSDQKPRGD